MIRKGMVLTFTSLYLALSGYTQVLQLEQHLPVDSFSTTFKPTGAEFAADESTMYVWTRSGDIVRLDRDAATGQLSVQDNIETFASVLEYVSADGRYFIVHSVELDENSECLELNEEGECEYYVDTFSKFHLFQFSEDGTAVEEIHEFDPSLNFPASATISDDGKHIYLFWYTDKFTEGNLARRNVEVESFSFDATTKTVGLVEGSKKITDMPNIGFMYKIIFNAKSLGDNAHFVMSNGETLVRNIDTGVITATGSHLLDAPHDTPTNDVVLNADGETGYTIGGSIHFGLFQKRAEEFGYDYVHGPRTLVHYTSSANAPYGVSPSGSQILAVSRDMLHSYQADEHGDIALTQAIPDAPSPDEYVDSTNRYLFSTSESHAYSIGRHGITGFSVHPHVSISGKITGADDEDTGILAAVIFQKPSTKQKFIFPTDASGHYRVEKMSPGEYEVRIQAPGYDDLFDTIEIMPTNNFVHDYVLEVAETAPLMFGRYFDERSGLPYVGEQIRYDFSGPVAKASYGDDFDHPISDSSDVVYTNAAGQFEIRTELQSFIRLNINLKLQRYPNEFSFQDLVQFNPNQIDSDNPTDLELRRAGTAVSVSGTISTNGVPLEGALVVAEGIIDFSTFSDQDGAYAFPKLIPGTIRIQASAAGFEFGEEQVDLFANGDSATVDIDLPVETVPVLTVNPTDISYDILGGVEVAAVENAGGGRLLWEGRFDPEVDWVTVDVSKQFTQGILSLRAAANIYGKYERRMTRYFVESDTALNSPQEIIIEQDAPPFLTDLDGVDGVNSVDIQLIINRLLSLPGAPENGDVNNDGQQDATDLQLVINAVLGV